jgi:outer membrane protein OmpA-like peptidoglycan-associated protein
MEGTQPPSPLQIHRNYENAIKRIGGKVLFSNDEYSFLRLARDGKEIWVEVTAYGPKPHLVIVEKQAMKQDVVADAASFARDLSATGKVAVYGIYFDTAKADLKPESDIAIAEIAKLLKQDASLKLFVVGHTDTVGDPAMNLKLSQARAQSVVAALTAKHGIPAARLHPFGAGPYAPVASNKDEDGRAKNRRVELVDMAGK